MSRDQLSPAGTEELVGSALNAHALEGRTIDRVEVVTRDRVERLILHAGDDRFEVVPLAVLTRAGARLADDGTAVVASLELICSTRPCDTLSLRRENSKASDAAAVEEAELRAELAEAGVRVSPAATFAQLLEIADLCGVRDA